MNLSPYWQNRSTSPASRLPAGGLRRTLEVALILLALVLLWPFAALVMLAIILDSPGSILYRQLRVALGGQVLAMLKFRTMQPGAEESLAALLEQSPTHRQEWQQRQKLPADPRLTRVGAFLRRFSLDELPQVINVLRGEMSLVGPRPILPEQRTLYGPALEGYIQVRPGITGLWQVSGRADTTFAERARLDAVYFASRGPGLDLRILLRTAWVVIKGKGAY
jgi:lipopolysaccharide/colanic/teichoic acid biosynthesis glycosyltransferase